MLRQHEPVVFEEFNGLYRRGNPESCPDDHTYDCENVIFPESAVETRPGLDTLIAQGNVLRLYNYKMQNGESLLILDTSGNIYHALLDGSDTVYGPILSIPNMTDFDIESVFGRAYITPYATFTDNNGVSYQKGLQNEFLYVYKGDGTSARKAAGNPPTNSDDTPFVAFNSKIDGLIDKGIHIFAVTFSDGADDSTGLGPTVLPLIYAPGGKEAIVNNIPIGGVGITERKIWATQAIDPKDYNPLILPPFLLVKTILDNTTNNTIVSFADTDLTVAFSAGTLPNPTSGGITAENSAVDGFCDIGLHVIGVVYETDTGFLTAPGPEVFAVQSFVNENKAIHVKGIPVSPDSFVIKRHLVASKAIRDYNGDDRGYQLFFIPEGTINDNTTNNLVVSFYDLDLLEDASHLIDNFAEIPAGVTLSRYEGRLALTTPFTDISIIYLSAPGEPEAFDQVDGILIMELDGNPVTNAEQFRNTFYTFKKTRTAAWNDNGDVPSTWKPTYLDQGIGTCVHGIAQVLDSGGVNVEFLLIIYFGGLFVFSGLYTEIPISWKIEDLWFELDRDDFGNIQIVNDSLTKVIYITLTNKKMLWCDYKNGLNPRDVKWSPMRFDIEATTIALIETNTLVIGSKQSII